MLAVQCCSTMVTDLSLLNISGCSTANELQVFSKYRRKNVISFYIGGGMAFVAALPDSAG